MPRCVLGHDAEETVYAVIGGRRIDMCLFHWAAWQRVEEGIAGGLSRWMGWFAPTWKHGEAQYQMAWEGGEIVGRRLSDNEIIANSSSATVVLNALLSQPAGLIRVEPAYAAPYPLTGVVSVTPGRRIRGYGRQSRFRVADDANFMINGVYYGAFYFGQNPQANRDCVVSDIAVDGNSEAEIEGSYIFHGRGASDITISDVEVFNTARFAIYTTVNACSEWKVEGCHIWGGQDDAWFVAAAAEMSHVEDCVFAHNMQSYGARGHPQLYDGGDIRTWGPVAPEIRRCASRFCGSGSPEGRYNIAGFHLRDNKGSLIEDCVVENGGSQGILLMNARSCVVKRTIVSGSQRYAGLYLEGCPASFVESVRVSKIAKDAGIVIGSWGEYRSHGTVVRNSRVIDTGGPGFFTDSSWATFVECEAESCGQNEAWQEYERAGFLVCGSLDEGSKVLRCRASLCRYGFSDRSSGAGIGNKATVADCDFTGCDDGYYFGNPNHQHVLVRNKLP